MPMCHKKLRVRQKLESLLGSTVLWHCCFCFYEVKESYFYKIPEEKKIGLLYFFSSYLLAFELPGCMWVLELLGCMWFFKSIRKECF